MALTHLLLLTMTIMGHHCSAQRALYLKEPGFADLMCPSEQVAFQTVAWNPMWCVRQCEEASPACKSMIYLKGNNTCFGLKSDNPFSASSSLPGAVFYKANNPPTTNTSTTPTTPTVTSSKTTPPLTTTPSLTTAPMPSTTQPTSPTATTPTQLTAMTDPGSPVVASLSDSQFAASGVYDPSHEPWNAKPNNTASCWRPSANDQSQWVQVNFSDYMLATHVITKGNPQNDYWLAQYKVETSTDCSTYVAVKDGSGNDKIFDGNVDRDTAVTNVLDPPIVCRCFRIHPWSAMGGNISLRFDVLVHAIPPGTPAVASLQDSQFTASSVSTNYDSWHAKINDSCWVPAISNQQQRIQVTFSSRMLATHIETKGHGTTGFNYWVAQYKVQTSAECSTHATVKDGLGNDKIFDGNVDRDSAVLNVLDPPVICRCFRLHPWAATTVIALRFEVLAHLV